MPDYRFQPARPVGLLALLVAFALATLGGPSVVAAFVPEPVKEKEPVVLGYGLGDWEIEVPDFECAYTVNVASMEGWECGTAVVQVLGAQDVEDPDLALQRAVRALGTGRMPSTPIHTAGGASILVERSIVALGVGKDGDAMQLIISGGAGDVRRAVTKIWPVLSSEPLPAPAEAALEGLRSSSALIDDFREVRTL